MKARRSELPGRRKREARQPSLFRTLPENPSTRPSSLETRPSSAAMVFAAAVRTISPRSPPAPTGSVSAMLGGCLTRAVEASDQVHRDRFREEIRVVRLASRNSLRPGATPAQLTSVRNGSPTPFSPSATEYVSETSTSAKSSQVSEAHFAPFATSRSKIVTRAPAAASAFATAVPGPDAPPGNHRRHFEGYPQRLPNQFDAA